MWKFSSIKSFPVKYNTVLFFIIQSYQEHMQKMQEKTDIH